MELFFILLILVLLYLFHISKSKLFATLFLSFICFTLAESIYIGDLKLVKENYQYITNTAQISEIDYSYSFISYDLLNPIANGLLWTGYILLVVAFINEAYKLIVGKYFI